MVLRKKWKYYKAAVLCKYCSNVYKRRHLWIEILEKSRTGGEIPLGAAEDLLFLNFLKLYEEKRSAWLTLKVSALRVFHCCDICLHTEPTRTRTTRKAYYEFSDVCVCVCVSMLTPALTLSDLALRSRLSLDTAWRHQVRNNTTISGSRFWLCLRLKEFWLFYVKIFR